MAGESEPPVVDFVAHLPEYESSTVDSQSEHVDDIYSDHEKYLEWFERGGVDNVVLSQSSYMGHDDLNETVTANDALLDVMERHDGVFGLAAIPVGAGGEEAAREFERCLDRGYNGGGMTTTSAGRNITDDVYEPVLEVADRTGAPVLINPTPTRKLEPEEHVLEPDYQNNHAFGREARMCASINAVIHEGILDRYPDLDLVYHHYGGNIASAMGRIDLRLTRNDGDTKPFSAFKDQLEERIYVDTSGYHAYSAPLRAALEQFPADNILLGTDSPYEPKTPDELHEYIETIRTIAPRSDARKMLGQNALDLMVNV